MSRRNPRILMCRPDYYGIEYEINPWMSIERGAERELAAAQWSSLAFTLKQLGVVLEELEPVAGLPDMVFTANAGLVHRQSIIPSHFRHPQRQGETAYVERWARDHEFEVCDIYSDAGLAGASFEGAGDALYCGQTLFAGYLNRSDIRIHHVLARQLRCRVISLELVDPYFYHLDTCFCPLSLREAIYYPPAFDQYAQRALRETIESLIEVNEADARRFGCNAVVVGKNVVLNAGCDQLASDLRENGYQTHPVDLSEFLKSGGSAKCLTLRLDGEEAAEWS